MEKIWEIKDPQSYLKSLKKRRSGKTAQTMERDPARAYTLSLLLWGAGQNYNAEYGTALAFRLLLFALVVFAAVAAVFHDALLSFLAAGHLFSRSFLAAEILFLVLLVIWVDLAGDAYRCAARSRSNAFPGVPSRVIPCVCSLMLPGWGQFLNGQPLKGSFFSAFAVIGIFSLVSIPAVLLVWPLLEPNELRSVIEDIFLVTVLAAPLVILIWLFSAHDALLVSLDEYRKEPLWERIRAANNRRRTLGFVPGVAPWIGRTFLLSLVLALCGVVVFENFPAGFYRPKLAWAGRELTGMGMTLLPDLIKRMVAVLPGP